MLEQVIVWVIVAVAAVYAAVKISRSFRKGSEHCGDCGISERGNETRGKDAVDGE